MIASPVNVSVCVCVTECVCLCPDDVYIQDNMTFILNFYPGDKTQQHKRDRNTHSCKRTHPHTQSLVLFKVRN